jgi:hypothetical protein
VIAIVAISLAAVGLLVLAVFGLHSSAVSTTAPSGGSTTSAPASNRDDWFAAMCNPGTTYNGFRLPNADGGATCTSRFGPILYGEYTSSYMARDDRARYHGWTAATAVAADGATILFLAPFNKTGNPLEPLSQFGLVVTLGS